MMRTGSLTGSTVAESGGPAVTKASTTSGLIRRRGGGIGSALGSSASGISSASAGRRGASGSGDANSRQVSGEVRKVPARATPRGGGADEVATAPAVPWCTPPCRATLLLPQQPVPRRQRIIGGEAEAKEPIPLRAPLIDGVQDGGISMGRLTLQ